MDWYYCYKVTDGGKHLVARSSELWSLRRYILRNYTYSPYRSCVFVISSDKAGRNVYEHIKFIDQRRIGGMYGWFARKPRSKEWIEITELGERVGNYPYTGPKGKKVTIEIYGK